MKHYDILAVFHLFRDESDAELKVQGKCFNNPVGAHSRWQDNISIYPSLERIGCYEAKSGLSEEVKTFPFARVVAKCFPFHMVLDFPPCPSKVVNVSDQWWTLVRFKHTCPPVTFPDDENE